MPMTVEEYRIAIGQLYTVNRHSYKQSEKGEGDEVVANKECEDPLLHGETDLPVGYREAFAWFVEWYGMTIDDVWNFEADIQTKTNDKVLGEK